MKSAAQGHLSSSSGAGSVGRSGDTDGLLPEGLVNPPASDSPAASAPLRTPEQMEWIRDRFKPDGLERLARAEREYADDHGHYLPDVAALAHAEWERAERHEKMIEGYYKPKIERLQAALERELAIAEEALDA